MLLQLHRSNNGVFLSRLFTHRGRILRFFSTSTLTSTALESPKSLTDYLVNSLGFTNEEAIATSLKVSFRKSKRNPNYVVDFFKQNGFDDTHIIKIVSKDPDVLRSDVEKTLKPKIRVLQNLGLSGSDLVSFVIDSRSLILRSISSRTLLAAIDFLTPILGTKENVVRVLRKLRWHFSIETITRIITFLQNYGVPSERIQKLIVRFPIILQYKLKNVEDVCARVVEKFGIPVESTIFITMIAVIAGTTEENLNLKLYAFKTYGWTESDIGTMIRKQPDCLMQSEVTIRRKLEYFMKEHCLEAGYIASHPTLLMYDVEKRVVRRNAVMQILKEKKLISARFTLFRAVQIGESRFLRDFVIPYKDELPGLFEAYSGNKMESFSKS